MTDETRRAIDAQSTYALLWEYRYAPEDDPRFQGDEGKYRAGVLAERRDNDPAEWAQASKDVGWNLW